MTEKKEYLTENELESLLRELEQNDLVPAPPDLMLDIMENIEREAGKKQEKVIAYKRYRLQVLTTVAAAVLAVLLLPKISNLQQPKKDFIERKYELEMQSRYETKEEALNDRGFLEKVLGGENIFANNSKLNLFRE